VFDAEKLLTPSASFFLTGSHSRECDDLGSPVEAAGLLPVATSIIQFGGAQLQEVGVSVSAGSESANGGLVAAQPGFVLWDAYCR